MTLLEVEELTRYWIEHPPLHLMVAAHLGLGKDNGGWARSKIVADDPFASGPFASGPFASGPFASGPFASGPLVSRAKPEVGAILAELGPRIAAGDVHAGFAPVVLDFAELKRTRRITE